jgi:hypothetical protein
VDAAAVRPGGIRVSARLLLVLELAVGAREEEGLMPVVESYEIGGTAVFTADLENLAVAVGLADLLAMNDETFTDSSSHCCPLSLVPAYARARRCGRGLGCLAARRGRRYSTTGCLMRAAGGV